MGKKQHTVTSKEAWSYIYIDLFLGVFSGLLSGVGMGALYSVVPNIKLPIVVVVASLTSTLITYWCGIKTGNLIERWTREGTL